MSGINKVILVGNVGADPDIKTLNNDRRVANLRVATSKKIKRNDEWTEITHWHLVVVWDQPKIKYLEYVKKGTKLYVEGELETRKWQDQDGNDRYTTEVVVNAFAGNLQIISNGKGSGEGGGQRQQQDRQESRQEYDDRRTLNRQQDYDLDDEIPF